MANASYSKRSAGLDNVFYVLEIEQRQLYRIKGIASWWRLLEHNRSVIISPDAKKLIWTKLWVDGFRIVMGDLLKDKRDYKATNVRSIYPPPINNDTDGEQWARAFAWYENKHLTDGGKTLVFAGTRDQGGNLDDYLLDLESGDTRRLTNHLEWDEGGEFSPDGAWFPLRQPERTMCCRFWPTCRSHHFSISF